jgi:para-nitrobenzyl esterase
MNPKRKMTRRSFLGAGAAGLIASRSMSTWAQDIRNARPSGVVWTTSGQLRGVSLQHGVGGVGGLGGVDGFMGIPYGAPTSGANRFMPPRKPEPWTGVRVSESVGNRAPQDLAGPLSEVHALDRQEPRGEDCLNLNVWTPDTRNGRRPVMVWLHGGGFSSGSGNWLLYDGANLARSQDVVVVTVTHRLNVFGFTHLAEIGGAQFADSGNVGVLDIVAALEWVRDNIEGFGGDPDNVTLFGQSGGGRKVSTLLAMPAAQGLYHRAITMSGSHILGVPRDRAAESAERLMATVGVQTVDALQNLSMQQLLEAWGQTPGMELEPVVDTRVLPRDPFYPDAPAISANIPMMISNTETEVTFQGNTPLEPMADPALRTRVAQLTGADRSVVEDLIRTYQTGRPGIPNIDLYQILASDNSYRAAGRTQADAKANQAAEGGAPVYMYYFTWRSPVREGKLKSYHCLDIPFAFNNVDEAASMTGAGQDRYLLADRMSGAFAAFARTGDPNHELLPNWAAFNLDQRATMIMSNDPHVEDDPNQAERLALKAIQQG